MKEYPAEIIKKKRETLGITQKEMANKLAICLNQTYSQRQYQKIEEGKFPKYKKSIIEEVDKILSTNVYELIYELNVPRETKVEWPPDIGKEKLQWDNVRLQKENSDLHTEVIRLNKIIAVLEDRLKNALPPESNIRAVS